jgi:hypothetical protein
MTAIEVFTSILGYLDTGFLLRSVFCVQPNGPFRPVAPSLSQAFPASLSPAEQIYTQKTGKMNM